MANYTKRDEVAVIELNNPPVNALSFEVRSGLQNALKSAIDDQDVKCIVIHGKGKNFSAGADIKEFGAGTKQQKPWITDACRLADESSKPVVAAIAGTALGGGLEVALFCHYRIGTPSCRVGFPEVQIGILPGAGGTQRLPRLIGVNSSIDMITSGRHVMAEEAMKLGILDKIVTEDIIEEGVKFAKSVVGLDLAHRILKNRKIEAVSPKVFDDEISRVKKKYKGYIAPLFCLKAIQASVQLPYDASMEQELQLFQHLVGSNQAKAQQYAFFAERTSARWQLPTGANSQNASPLPVKTAGVIGAGTMGAGIALCLITSGIPTVLVEQDQKFLEKGIKTMEGDLRGSVALKKMTAEQAKKAMLILKPSVNFEDLHDVDLVIEAVYENLALKKEIFAKLDKICQPQTILCTNTSSLDIDMIAEATKRMDKVVGTHFFAPAYIMKLQENVYGKNTSAETVATVMALGRRIRKVPVLVGTCESFAANRMLHPYVTEALYLVEEGASPYEVDQVLEDFGMPMGMFRVSDLSGLDIGYKVRREAAKRQGIDLTLGTRFVNGERVCLLADVLVEKGRLGIKSGKGWYNYGSPGKKEAIPDPEVLDIIEEHCRKFGIKKQKISSQEILERMQLALINEGFRILEEGIVSKPEDIDVIWIYGFGWPKYMGGPMFYANEMKLKNVYRKICDFHQKYPFSIHWTPSKLLARLSETDLPISNWTSLINSNSKL
ncbi:hypothetical protein CHS0354_043032 [Potamilus streckersoni]|uniref:Peroxisomal bifunctional enzyme n=1 Tax=Potamilus streckersoni TaxID=2493646 RepID=A0AAE0SDB6_9BIVA|nr:hypothetical protein CHS0354_043032 [Potamilus streckersoni]